MKLWIARDKNDTLALYTEEPMLYYNEYYEGPYKSQRIDLDGNLFPEITFENSPQEVELKLVNEIVGVAESPLKTFPRVNEFEVGASYRR